MSVIDFFRNLLRLGNQEEKMDQELNEDVPIMYSNEKLKMLLEESGLPLDEVFTKYVNSLKYDVIKDFPVGTSWFNTKEPLSFKKQLKGKLVLLDFFTYCCINCMHILPDLKEIEHSFSVEDGLVVIGVHSAKFQNETVAQNVHNAVLRYGIEHPVVNDDGARMWKQCDIHCWPSLLLVSPNGQPLVMLMGEGHKESLKLYIKHFLAYYKKDISRHSLPIEKSGDFVRHQESLLFPGKLSAFEDRLCISDSGNNRLIVVDGFDTNDKEVLTIGSPCGEIGFHDGALTDAMFNQPQGVAFLNRDVIFVADTENHAIRRVDLKSGLVSTIAGNGSQSNDRNGGRIGTQQGISSPWDLVVYTTDTGAKVLLVAMAGMHQIWAVFLENTNWWKGKEYAAGMVVCIAGSGREENRNNNYPNNAAFAQPSGLALDDREKMVYIADSESSSVRKLSLVDGKVSAVVGGDKNPINLFAFGDKDGVAYDGKLQHCLGLAMGKTPRNEGKLFVADTYNHKIKVIDTRTNHLKTIKSPAFNEPCGLLQTPNGELYVADTNSHQIKICTLNEDETEITNVAVLKLQNIDLQAMPETTDAKKEIFPYVNTLNLAENTTVNVNFNINLVSLDWTEGAPQKWSATSVKGCVAATPSTGTRVNKFKTALRLVKDKIENESSDVVEVSFQLHTCQGDVCFTNNFLVRFSVTFTQAGTNYDVNANITIDKDGVKVTK